MTTVLKVYKYRGISVYVRHLEGRLYEVLIPFKNQIHAHQLYVIKPTGKEKRVSMKDRDEGAVKELMLCGNTMIDNFKIETSFGKVVKNKINKIKQYYETKINRSAGASGGVSGIRESETN